VTKEQAGDVQQPSEAERVAAEQRAAQEAADRRELQAQQYADRLKSYPDDAAPPSQRVKGGEKAYSYERLTHRADAEAFTGYPHHVVVGALSGSRDEYLTVAEAKARIVAWLDRPIGEAG
jgi:hypothetical protein